MKKTISIALALALCASASFGFGCGEEKPPAPSDIVVEEGYTRYDITSNNGRTTTGFGAQFDTDVFMPWNNMTEEDEAMVARRVSEMNLQYTRIKFFPEYFERGNDNTDPNVFNYDSPDVDFNSTEMQALYKVLDICEANDMDIDLSWYDCNSTFKSYDKKYVNSWLGYDPALLPNKWCTAPKMKQPKLDGSGNPVTEDGVPVFEPIHNEDGTLFDGYKEMAENVSAVLKYLIEDKGYTCVNGISMIPEGFYIWDGSLSWTEYVELCKVVDARLKADGLRDKVAFIGPSDSAMNKVKSFKEHLVDLEGLFDEISIGNYNWDDKTDPTHIRYFMDSYAEACDGYKGPDGKGKNLGISECGTVNLTDAVTRSDIGTYEAGMYMAKLAVQCMNAGLTKVNYYILGDTFFNNEYVHRLGLWQYRSEGWKVHPTYHFWSLVCRFSDLGSEIYPMTYTDPDVLTVAFRLPTGKWSYMIVNNANENKKIAVVNENENRPGNMNVYKITESMIPANGADTQITSSSVENAASGVVHLNLSPRSFVVLSDK